MVVFAKLEGSEWRVDNVSSSGWVLGYGGLTWALILSSLGMFAACASSAVHVLGRSAALKFIAIALGLGWFAEQMGSSYGWFFGSYDYTAVLGPCLGDVPIVIPLMWFALTYIAYLMANLILWHAPVEASTDRVNGALSSLLAAMIVTAYDLGADPYMVFKLKAWIMTKTDGAWFGETVQGFVGWMLVSLAIVVVFRVAVPTVSIQPAGAWRPRDVLIPVWIYAGLMAFQVVAGFPVETRSIAVFAMGMPLLCALAGWRRWARLEQRPRSL